MYIIYLSSDEYRLSTRLEQSPARLNAWIKDTYLYNYPSNYCVFSIYLLMNIAYLRGWNRALLDFTPGLKISIYLSSDEYRVSTRLEQSSAGFHAWIALQGNYLVTFTRPLIGHTAKLFSD